MIGLDTNVIIRYIAQDDPKQAKAATRLIEQSITPDTPGFINQIVLCEIVWVLKRSYKLDKTGICQVIEQIMRTDSIVIEDIQLVWKALELYKKSKIDFADCLLGQRNLQAGCQFTATLDGAASEIPGYRHVLESP